MRIDSVELFYAAMPEVTLDADGSQDALLVRVTGGNSVGWGECEASPLVSIAAFVAPRSHGVCQPVQASIQGQVLSSAEDIRRIGALVRRNSMDLLQAPHILSGIEMALWDLLGHEREEPVWKLLGHRDNHPKTPYASVLFASTPQETLRRGREWVARGFQAVKFGWGSFGTGTLADDADQLHAAREGVGDARLMIDAGQVFNEDIESAAKRLPYLEDTGVTWLEEPFSPDAYSEYASLSELSSIVGIAGGEASHNPSMAANLITYGRVQYIQIDAGRIGGIGPSKAVAEFAAARGIQYVNHTFTSHLALSASLQPYAASPGGAICEYPVAPTALAASIVAAPLELDHNGELKAPDLPGLGVEVDLAAVRPYLQTVEIAVNGRTLFAS